MSTAIERLLATARGEIGYLEKETNSQLEDKTANAGDNNWTKYAAFLDGLGIVYNGKKNGYAWCDMFVDWCFITTFGLELGMKMTNQAERGYGAGCYMSANYYKYIDCFHEDDPQPGDQIFFTSDGGKTMEHTGIVEKVEGGRVYTIEGNTSSVPGVVANGGMVREKSYSLTYNRIGGYGTPLWNLVPENEQEDDDMDKARFTELFNEMRRDLQDNDCGQYSEEARNWATETGLILGGGDLNGEPNYMWQDMMTREQFVTVLYRFAQMMGAV